MRLCDPLSASLSAAGVAAASHAGRRAQPSRLREARGPQPGPGRQVILRRPRRFRLAPDTSHWSRASAPRAAKLLEVGSDLPGRLRDAAPPPSALAARGEAQGRVGRSHALPAVPGADRDDARQSPRALPRRRRRRRRARTSIRSTSPRPEYDAYLAAHPDERAELTHLRSVVRRADSRASTATSPSLRQYPVLESSIPALLRSSRALAGQPGPTQPSTPRLIRSPMPTRWSARPGCFTKPPQAVEADDAEFARYLRNRARDLLSDDYESGDAAWITGRFKNLNAQIGAYETYDDELLGTRAFYALSLLAAAHERTDGARARRCRACRRSRTRCPTTGTRRCREDIPVGVYDVIADFGQSRGGNTATNPAQRSLSRAPLRPHHPAARQHHAQSPEIFGGSGDDLGARSCAPQFAGHLTADSHFYRTLWHEVGHYLGADRTARRPRPRRRTRRRRQSARGDEGRPRLAVRRRGAAPPRLFQRRCSCARIYASGILRTLQNVKPRREQPYQT